MEQPTTNGAFASLSTIKCNVAAQAVCLVIAFLAVSLRFYIKMWLGRGRNVSSDDWMCLLSLMMLLAFGTMGIYYIFTYAHHEGTAQLEHILKWNHYLEILYGPTILATKLAILLLFKKLLLADRAGFTWWSYQVFVYVLSSFYLAITITKVFECNPISKVYNPTVLGTCINNGILVIVSGTMNLATDIVLLAIPIYTICGSNMKLKQQLRFIPVFAFGALAPIAALARLIITIQHKSSSTSVYFAVALCCTLEVTAGIVASCFPLLAGMFTRYWLRIQSLYKEHIGPKGAKARFNVAFEVEWQYGLMRDAIKAFFRKVFRGGAMVQDDVELRPTHIGPKEAKVRFDVAFEIEWQYGLMRDAIKSFFRKVFRGGAMVQDDVELRPTIGYPERVTDPAEFV